MGQLGTEVEVAEFHGIEDGETGAEFGLRHGRVAVGLGEVGEIAMGGGEVALPLGVGGVSGGEAFADGQGGGEVAFGGWQVALGGGKFAESI
ncbi:MAG: hypothetical protein NTW21_20830 [Verrucomicrobia bacterium]|nr:hypothetical protein [Verrucomicrobiota bacterium]